MKVEFLESDHPLWPSFLDHAQHQPYHLPAHADIWATYENGRAEEVLITENDDYFFLPYVLRSLAHLQTFRDAETYWDLTSPYGYPGPLIRSTTPSFLQRALKAWVALMKERRVVSGFVRMDPLEVHRPPELADFGMLCHRGETVSVDLTLSERSMWRQIRPAIRRNILRAYGAGMSVNMFFGNGPHRLFQEIYFETMERVNARPKYYFPKEHFEALTRMLGKSLCICTADDFQGRTIAAGLFLEYRGVVQHHLQGTRERGLLNAAAKLLVYAMMRAAQRRGNRILHLGGGRQGRNDSLFQFKASFSKSRHPFVTWHLAFLADEYRKLSRFVRDDRATCARHVFFPAYRECGACS